jgi:hypothetical protein
MPSNYNRKLLACFKEEDEKGVGANKSGRYVLNRKGQLLMGGYQNLHKTFCQGKFNINWLYYFITSLF